MRYAFAVDRRDWDLLASCFSPEVESDGWGRATGPGRGPLLEFIKGVAHFHTTMHMMGNHFVHVDADRAELDCYAMLTHHYDRAGEPAQMNVSGGRYVDVMERVDGRWRICRRGGEPGWRTSGRPDDAVGTTRALLDRAEIHDLLMGYAVGLDQRDYERVAACFAETFSARYGQQEFTDIDELVAFVRGVEFFESTTHFFARPWIEVRGDEAYALTYAMITHRPQEYLSAGPAYRDRLVREDGGWRIAERGIELPDLSGATDLPDPASLAPDLAWLVDRELIRHTTTQWVVALDQGDDELALSCLAPTFTVTLEPGGPEISDAAELSRVLKAGPPAGRTCHWPGNQLIDLTGDEARVETYVYRSERESEASGFTGWPEGALRLTDRMVRVDGRWRVTERRVSTNRVL